MIAAASKRFCMATKSIANLMESSNKNPIIFLSEESWKSQRLRVLAQQLREYKPSVSSYFREREVYFSSGKPGRAAVLICLFENECGDLRVILTKRSSNLHTHSGEVSLPGGKAEEGDADDTATALREAREEIGLDPALVRIVAVLEPFLSKHLMKVVPVIGILSDKEAFKPNINPEEVDSIFDAPLEMFLKDEKRRSEEREWRGSRYLLHYFDFLSENGKMYVIWGLTAGILIRSASIIYQRPPAFIEVPPNFIGNN
ncbi:nudix hydrolase 15, mitochondrial [Amborella trichopoda]|uniref:Nudix hydrolase domain-containing protein n=1 Tax=Amborella trichopoda TaxID=13333 RepID=W1Q0L0_AMBTC|nr:nudix hydrolase 15, mitochondrial [Amborella trichopoda]ERN13971.1 hypothetical protein AMTR_s00021p00154630 [Amborella trichopoda]|eukprot:XP_006852504.3 nudix hydrolase 15, mitochondrial [Amborella trichopoda]